MALREFTDARGIAWRVWDTRPVSTAIRDAFRGGWLTFEQGTEQETEQEAGHGAMRRRLAPIPEGWEDLPEGELLRLRADAQPEAQRQRLIE